MPLEIRKATELDVAITACDPVQDAAVHDVRAEPTWRDVDDYFERMLVGRDAALDAAVAASDGAGMPAHQVAPNQGKLPMLLARDPRRAPRARDRDAGRLQHHLARPRVARRRTRGDARSRSAARRRRAREPRPRGTRRARRDSRRTGGRVARAPRARTPPAVRLRVHRCRQSDQSDLSRLRTAAQPPGQRHRGRQRRAQRRGRRRIERRAQRARDPPVRRALRRRPAARRDRDPDRGDQRL